MIPIILPHPDQACIFLYLKPHNYEGVYTYNTTLAGLVTFACIGHNY